MNSCQILGARNRGGRRTDETESEKISARAKLYAASCPDVTQHTNENGLDYAAVDMKRELDEENVRASQPVLYKAEPLHENFPAQRSRFCALHGQRRRQVRLNFGNVFSMVKFVH